MDPISVSVLAALVGGAGGEAGRQAWQGLATLVRRPFRRDDDTPGSDPLPHISTGLPELTALQNAPTDPARAQALVTALSVRAALDAEFRGFLEEWWQRAQSVGTGGNVHNNIGGGTYNAPVVQGRDFSGISFTTPPAGP
ncbi:hypothetical protein [Streptomyces sp. I05A-00742]|uniref:hypothetical protein n=1 Tax=Streptomyces sp. I05A-00742 TaxID=2732853 RepID=UPI00148A0C5F|nr:hypothetical protein [Streptomyces sp. I05A-00742]